MAKNKKKRVANFFITLKIIKEIAGFLRQVSPRIFWGSDLEIAQKAMFQYLGYKGYDLPTILEVLGKPYTVQSLEEMYEKGYSAIINDGKLVGFVREKANA